MFQIGLEFLKMNGIFLLLKKGQISSLSIAYLEKFKNATKIWANGLSILEWKIFRYQKKGK